MGTKFFSTRLEDYDCFRCFFYREIRGFLLWWSTNWLVVLAHFTRYMVWHNRRFIAVSLLVTGLCGRCSWSIGKWYVLDVGCCSHCDLLSMHAIAAAICAVFNVEVLQIILSVNWLGSFCYWTIGCMYGWSHLSYNNSPLVLLFFNICMYVHFCLQVFSSCVEVFGIEIWYNFWGIIFVFLLLGGL